MGLIVVIIASLIVGGILGYAFRGKENALIKTAGTDIQNEVKKL